MTLGCIFVFQDREERPADMTLCHELALQALDTVGCTLAQSLHYQTSLQSLQLFAVAAPVVLQFFVCLTLHVCRCNWSQGFACAEHQQLGPLVHWPLQPSYNSTLPAAHGRPNWAGPPKYAAGFRWPSLPAHQVHVYILVLLE